MRVRVSQSPRTTAGRRPSPASLVEELGLSVRTCNALHKVGCHTIEDTLRLDLTVAVRGFGSKARDELLTALERAGFHHTGFEDQPTSEIRTLERSLERMQGRIDAALSAVAKEIQVIRQRLHKKAPHNRAKPIPSVPHPSTPPPDDGAPPHRE